ncbi:hypothetical protein BC830DRAFT_1167758 [Chytriomyces sp. MP71]|nr:hypothetical protein BC830DRAFT_1167758 [Chytriomyces sp. MP71]
MPSAKVLLVLQVASVVCAATEKVLLAGMICQPFECAAGLACPSGVCLPLGNRGVLPDEFTYGANVSSYFPSPSGPSVGATAAAVIVPIAIIGIVVYGVILWRQRAKMVKAASGNDDAAKTKENQVSA